ncbi:hypothetical protein GCM10009721_36320 [Terrabacter tumescens]|uniref:Uncharacterized protein n=1 Tax=Terrabacter tumescens TaxID=60443 RepID=A0ABQ2IE44_9MICO|nr:hypothetical protein GCM10009721_36320 [Terrabacter tumescens]
MVALVSIVSVLGSALGDGDMTKPPFVGRGCEGEERAYTRARYDGRDDSAIGRTPG